MHHCDQKCRTDQWTEDITQKYHLSAHVTFWVIYLNDNSGQMCAIKTGDGDSVLVIPGLYYLLT